MIVGTRRENGTRLDFHVRTRMGDAVLAIDMGVKGSQAKLHTEDWHD